MSKLTKNNLQLFCRICLGSLQDRTENVYNIYLIPNFRKLLVIYTSLDIDEEDQVYPNSLCQLCYDKLQDFQSFRCMAQHSAEILKRIIDGDDCSNIIGTDQDSSWEKNFKGAQNLIQKGNIGKSENFNEDTDNHLLLPELSGSSFLEKPLKIEIMDIESHEMQSYNPTTRLPKNKLEVKNELDVDSGENSTSFETKSSSSNFEATSANENGEKNSLEMYNQNNHIDSPGEKYFRTSRLSKKLIQNYSINNDEDYICQVCNKKFSSKYALINHLKRHSNFKEHICEICGVAKTTRSELQTHMRRHQPNAEKFKCSLCPQEFKHKNAIQRHVRTVHEGLRPYACSYCPKHFGTQTSRKSHERLHTGERPFSCEVCHRSFAQTECLRSHMKNHDKSLRTHVCKYCSQRFITRKNLSDHEERHRGGKPHICEICNRGFFKQNDLTNHQKCHENTANILDGECYKSNRIGETFFETPSNLVMELKSPIVMLNKSDNLSTSKEKSESSSNKAAVNK